MKAGDHFVIRFYSPVETIGGGVVLNPNGVKRKKRQNADVAVHCACTGRERKKAHAAGKITEEMCGNSVFLQLQELYLKSGFMPPLTDEVKKVFSGERDFQKCFLPWCGTVFLYGLTRSIICTGKYGRKPWIWYISYLKKGV